MYLKFIKDNIGIILLVLAILVVYFGVIIYLVRKYKAPGWLIAIGIIPLWGFIIILIGSSGVKVGEKHPLPQCLC
jgi:hypothetical protein